VVLDYLWGKPAESALKAIAQKGLSKLAARVPVCADRFKRRANYQLERVPAALRRLRLQTLGSGFGSASLDQIKAAIGEFFKNGRRGTDFNSA